MSTTIWVDQQRGTAVLVLDDPCFALGPAIAADTGEEAFEVMQYFVDALEGPADKMPTIELMNEWQTFLMAFHGTIQVPTEVAEAIAADNEARLAAGMNGQDPAAGLEVGPSSPLPDPDPDPDDDDDEPAAEQLLGEHQAQAAAAIDEAADKPPICWACSGKGELVIEGKGYPCGTCDGKGVLEAEATA